MTMEEVEGALSAAYDAGKADTGLYDAGLKFVVFDVLDGQKTFHWFDQAKDLSDTLHV